ncbi:extensin-like domain-containing protein [Thalassococcus lentus]|uniref:Extensin family protein n=1 Tax=Thalassococcus lentus TaxID=1210524 RepID=A0ABT4XSP0_9RHOB|nr:extensin family protein [Thalassococcus lentus]MDA7424922.1 extensin family protein [Thalassococcus lentus]
MRWIILGSFMIALASCGGRAPEPKQNDDLDGVRGFLKNAFATSSDEKSGAIVGGGLCGDPMLVGEVVGAVPDKGACGVENAVRLRQVGDVTLSQPATITCDTAKALRTWVETGVKPAIGKTGGGVSSLRVAAHYACRTRNHQPGAKISEHGKGKAIDISAINLADGSSITIQEGWRGKHSKKLRAMHKAACGPFGTVLGPDSDRFHQDHFHFDTASYRSGSYCR